MSLYRLHGVVIDSGTWLPALAAPPGLESDWRASYEVSSAPSAAPDEGEIMAISEVIGARYRALRGAHGLLCRYDGLGDVLFGHGAELRVLTHTEDLESARALLSGSALALWCVARGRLVLHASAVAWAECTLAIVGTSNSGKTTLAAQCVLGGARLLSDDVLRVDVGQGSALWHAGVRWLRLRRPSRELCGAWPGEAYESTRDGRWVVLPTEDQGPHTGQLDALVFPKLDETASELRIAPVPPGEALRRLLLVPRVRGLKAPDLLHAQLKATAELARTVPAYEALLPIGAPLGSTTATRLREHLARLGAGRAVS